MTDKKEELKQKAIETYVESEPTPENSMEIVKQIAEDIGVTPNAVRVWLTNAGVYVKKGVVFDGKKKTSSGNGTGRVSKESNINVLKENLTAAGFTPDDDICDKLTGKAAAYFAGVIGSLLKSSD